VGFYSLLMLENGLLLFYLGRRGLAGCRQDVIEISTTVRYYAAKKRISQLGL